MAIGKFGMANHHLPSPNQRPKMERTMQQQGFNRNEPQQFVGGHVKASYQTSLPGQNGLESARPHGPNNEALPQPISGNNNFTIQSPMPPFCWASYTSDNTATPLRVVGPAVQQQGTIHSPPELVGSPTFLRALGGYGQPANYMMPLQPTFHHGMFQSRGFSISPPFPLAMSPGLVVVPQTQPLVSTPGFNSPMGDFSGGLIGRSQRSSLGSTSTSASYVSTDGGSSAAGWLHPPVSTNPLQYFPSADFFLPMCNVDHNHNNRSSQQRVRENSEDGRVSLIELKSPKPRIKILGGDVDARPAKRVKNSPKEKDRKQATPSKKRPAPLESASSEDNEPSPPPSNPPVNDVIPRRGQEGPIINRPSPPNPPVNDPPGQEGSIDRPYEILDSKVPGSNRLTIDFLDYGVKGPIVQYASKNGVIIPHGLKGTHHSYKENWEFEVLHSSNPVIDGKWVPITFRVTDKKTSNVTEVTESEKDVEKRRDNGRLIANRVFKQAINTRKGVLKEELDKETDEDKRMRLMQTLKDLSPKRITQGPLAFGLQHQIVQEKLGVIIIKDKKEAKPPKTKKKKTKSSSSSASLRRTD